MSQIISIDNVSEADLPKEAVFEGEFNDDKLSNYEVLSAISDSVGNIRLRRVRDYILCQNKRMLSF